MASRPRQPGAADYDYLIKLLLIGDSGALFFEGLCARERKGASLSQRVASFPARWPARAASPVLLLDRASACPLSLLLRARALSRNAREPPFFRASRRGARARRSPIALASQPAPLFSLSSSSSLLSTRPKNTGVGKSCLLLRFAEDSFTPSFITTIGCVQSLASFRSAPRP